MGFQDSRKIGEGPGDFVHRLNGKCRMIRAEVMIKLSTGEKRGVIILTYSHNSTCLH